MASDLLRSTFDPTLWPSFAEPLLGIARKSVRPEDSADLAFRKVVFTAGLLLALPLQVFIATALALTGSWAFGLVIIGLAVLNIAVLTTVVYLPRSFEPLVIVLALANQVGAFSIAHSSGGLSAGGFNIIWAELGPLITLVLVGPRAGATLYAVFCAGVFHSFYSDPMLEHLAFGRLGSALNVCVAVATVLVILGYFNYHRRMTLHALDEARQQADDLLDNVLPESVVHRLKRGEGRIADHSDSASILFADIVGFTELSGRLSAAELVDLLDELFEQLDGLVEQHGLEKIKTIGDCYMVASGLPEARDDHAAALTRFAVDMRDLVGSRPFAGHTVSLRIGMHCGPVVAGVIGVKRFLYDTWGDTVNIASRMESSGLPDHIQVSADMAALLGEDFLLTRRGTVVVKGKGSMETWFVA